MRVRPTRHPKGLVSVLLLAVALLATGGVTHGAGSPSLDVTFFANGQISVTLPDGTPVGTASGAPTVIPAGYYQVLLSGPGGCVQVSAFDLEGPGVSKVNNLDDGEVQNTGFNAYFAPNSTYTWRNDGAPGTVNTFSTSATIVGAPPTVGSNQAPVTGGSSANNTTSQDIVGSSTAGSTTMHRTIVGTLNAAGKLSVSFNGQSIRTLLPGVYTITVTDHSSADGFTLKKKGHRALTVTGSAFTGKHSVSVDLTAGSWLFGAAGSNGYSIVVS